ncbi:MAG: SEC-C metal-binding domain-containing protein [Chloroflexota bacterium]
MTRATITDTAIRLLRAHHTRTTAQIAAHVVKQGISRAADPAASVNRQLRWDSRFCHLTGDRWILVEVLLAVPAAHRLTPQEVASNSLAVGADLAHLPGERLFDLRLSTGEPLQFLRGDVAEVATGVQCGLAVRGPAGWLGHPAGTLVKVTGASGALRIEPATPPPPGARLRVRRLVEATRRSLDSMPPGIFGEPVTSIGDVLIEVLGDDPSFMAEPLPPFGELFEGTGLEVHRAYVGRAGRDWSKLDEFIERSRAGLRHLDGIGPDGDVAGLAAIAVAVDGEDARDRPIADHVPGFDDATLDALVAEFDLDAEEAKTLGLLLDLYVVWRVPSADGSRPADSPTMGRNMAELVGLELVALALAEHAWSDPAFEAFVADLRAGARGSNVAGPEFLLGACAEARGSIEEAERHYRAALGVDPDYFPARFPLYRLDVDRGNYAAALVHLRTVGMPSDDPSRAWLETIVQPAFAPVGRNEPCPCGSGRKFKVCHLDRPALDTTPKPADALFRKLSLWVEQSDVQKALVELVHEVIGEPHRMSAADGSPHTKAAAAAEELLLGGQVTQTIDVLLFDRGWLDRLLAVRGPLLPPVERALAEAWRSTRRSVYEMVAVRPGTGVTMRDIVNDAAPVDVDDRSLARTAEPLDLVFLRLRPDVDGRLLATDGILVPRSRRAFVSDLVRSKDAIGQLRWISFPPPAPRLQNMEGEPILLVTASYRLADPAAAGRALARTLREDEDGVFTESVVRRGRDWTRGTVRIAGDTATIQANSKKRADRLVRTLLRAAPGARLIKREERGPEEALDEYGASAEDGGDPGELLDPAEHPELQDVLDRMLRDFERSWVDERIPALGGQTPRDAVRDPAGRREVLALLDDMEWEKRRAATHAEDRGGSGGGMDPGRLRALLGLAGPDLRPGEAAAD